MKSRILVAVVGVPILLYVVLWAPAEVMEVGLALLSAVAGYELMKCMGAGGAWRRAAAAAAAVYVLAVSVAEEDVEALVVGYVIAFFLCAIIKAGEIPVQLVLGALFAAIAIPYAFTAFLRIHAAGHRGYLLLPFIFSFASDTCAFFAGHAFGKHKLAPKVSPNKTVEGSIGGLVGNAVCGVLFAYVMNTWFGQDLDYAAIVLLGLVCSVIAQIGDLSFSYIKREFGIKDYGHIFLAHGGVLDRFDSVLFVAPVMALVMPYLVG